MHLRTLQIAGVVCWGLKVQSDDLLASFEFACAKIDIECCKSQWMIFKDIERKGIKRKPTKGNMLIFSRLYFHDCWKRISEEASHPQFQLANLYHKVKVWSNAIEVVISLEPSLPTFRIKRRSFAFKKNKLQLWKFKVFSVREGFLPFWISDYCRE